MTMKLPELPEPTLVNEIVYSGIAINKVEQIPLFTADQMQAYARTAVSEALERAANEVPKCMVDAASISMFDEVNEPSSIQYALWQQVIAAGLRALAAYNGKEEK